MIHFHEKPRSGEIIVLRRLPPNWLDDLPETDQHTISAVIAKPILLLGDDDDGRAELEFIDSEGVIHTIFVNPEFISKS